MKVNANYFKLLTHSQFVLDTIVRNFINCMQITLKMSIFNRYCVCITHAHCSTNQLITPQHTSAFTDYNGTLV